LLKIVAPLGKEQGKKGTNKQRAVRRQDEHPGLGLLAEEKKRGRGGDKSLSKECISIYRRKELLRHLNILRSSVMIRSKKQK